MTLNLSSPFTHLEPAGRLRGWAQAKADGPPQRGVMHTIYVPVSLSEGGGPAIWLVTLYNTRNIP